VAALAQGAGVTIKSVLWTTGACDILPFSEGPEDALTTLNMKMAAMGNVRTQTLRGVAPAEMRKLVAGMKLPPRQRRFDLRCRRCGS
jgi:uncharacterized protein with GYD domain